MIKMPILIRWNEKDAKNGRRCPEQDMGRVASGEMARYQMVLARRVIELVVHVTRYLYH